MALVLNGDGEIGGLVAGGLPDASVTQSELAANVVGNGPAFSTYNGSLQSISAATYTKIGFSVEDYDTANCFNTSLNRFTPNVAGYYFITGNSIFGTSGTAADGMNYWVALFKNGNSLKQGLTINAGGNNDHSSNISCIVYMNGTTDYLELYAYCSKNINLPGSSLQSFFQGVLLRAA